MRLLFPYFFIFLCFFSNAIVCDDRNELRQSCSPFENDSLQCLCSNSYTSITSVIQSRLTDSAEKICALNIKEKLVMALELPLTNDNNSSIHYGVNMFTYLQLIFSQETFSQNKFFDLLSKISSKPPFQMPIGFANILSFPSYQKLLTILESIQVGKTGDASKWLSSPEDQIIFTITPSNVIGLMCEASQLASLLGDVGVKIQCKLNRLLQSVFVCLAKNELELYSSGVMKNYLLKSLSIEIATAKSCNYKINDNLVTYTETKNKSVFFSLEDLHVSEKNPLPDLIPGDIIEKERFAYLLLLVAARKANTFLLTASPRNDAIVEPMCDFIPGWKTELVVFVREEGLNVELSKPPNRKDNKVPFLFVSRFIKNSTNSNNNTCDILIVTRPTVTRAEWYNNFIGLLTPFLPSNNLKYMAHSGFVKAAKAVDEQLVNYIFQLLHNKCSSVNAYFTGHSLGAATGQLLTLLVRERIQSEKLKINGVFFASPNVFNKEAAEYYANVVNSRIITHPRDPVTFVPCSVNTLPQGYPSCPSFDLNQQKFDRSFRNIFYQTPGRYSIPYVTEREIVAAFHIRLMAFTFYKDFMKFFHLDVYYNWVYSFCIA